MVSRRAKAVLLARDAVVTIVAVVIIGSSWGKWTNDPVFLILDSIMAIYLILSAIDVALILAKVKRKGFFVGNSAFQIIPGLLLAGLLAPLGIIIIVLNVVALLALREKKTAEELAKHPPIPITRNFRWTLAVGTLVMLGSMLLPAISTSDATLSLFGLYSALLTHSGLPGLSIQPTAVIFALLAIVLSPVAVVCGTLGLVRRRFSFFGGTFGVVAGLSLVAALSGAAGVGSYVMVAGGAVALAAFFLFRRA